MSSRQPSAPVAVALVAIALTIPAALLLNVWQGYRFQSLRRETTRMEAMQREWLEKNKRAIAGIEVYLSPARLRAVAEEQLNLRRLQPAEMVSVRLTPSVDATGEEALWSFR